MTTPTFATDRETELWKRLIKNSAVKLCREHRAACDREDCGVSLYHIRCLLEMAEIEVEAEDLDAFV